MSGHQPQPFEQLAALCTSIGQPPAARSVLYAKERHQRTVKNAPGRLLPADRGRLDPRDRDRRGGSQDHPAAVAPGKPGHTDSGRPAG
jgi:hypothetical protein